MNGSDNVLGVSSTGWVEGGADVEGILFPISHEPERSEFILHYLIIILLFGSIGLLLSNSFFIT